MFVFSDFTKNQSIILVIFLFFLILVSIFVRAHVTFWEIYKYLKLIRNVITKGSLETRWYTRMLLWTPSMATLVPSLFGKHNACQQLWQRCRSINNSFLLFSFRDFTFLCCKRKGRLPLSKNNCMCTSGEGAHLMPISWGRLDWG